MKFGKANTLRAFVSAIGIAISSIVLLQGCTGGGGGYRDNVPPSDHRGS